MQSTEDERGREAAAAGQGKATKPRPLAPTHQQTRSLGQNRAWNGATTIQKEGREGNADTNTCCCLVVGRSDRERERERLSEGAPRVSNYKRKMTMSETAMMYVWMDTCMYVCMCVCVCMDGWMLAYVYVSMYVWHCTLEGFVAFKHFHS